MIRSTLAAFALVAGLTPALALEVDFAAPILALDGRPIQACAEKTEECQRPITLGTLSGLALSRNSDPAAARGGNPVAPDEKLRRGQLALRVYGAGKLDLAVEDVALIKRALGEAVEPLFFARADALLDPRK